MMNCDWTEKISLLVDGELAREEAARVESHLATCAACREARAGFLGLRREIRAYEHAPDILAQRRALENILAAGGVRGDATLRAGERRTEREARRQPARVREWLSGAFAASGLRPAFTAAAIFMFAVGLVLYINFQDSSTQHETASRQESKAVVQPTLAPSPDATREVATSATPEVAKPHESPIENGGAQGDRATAGVGGVRRNKREINVASTSNAGGHGRITNATRVGEPEGFDGARGALPETAVESNSAESIGAASDVAIATTRRGASVESLAPEAEAARHVERAEVLLRSFRNARFSRSDAGYDAASQKERSRKLLYQNILLRRDAATRGDLPVQNLLSRLEPVLLDIANLPDNPSSADVRPIRERIERKKMVALLQVHTPLASRSAY